MAKLSKESVSFEHPAKGSRHCAACRHYQTRWKSCEIVAGVVEPGDWCEKWEAKVARLTYGERKSLPKSEFALPGVRHGGKGGYPIPDESHARNALARVSQHGSPAQKRAVRSKVRRRYPGIKMKPLSSLLRARA